VIKIIRIKCKTYCWNSERSECSSVSMETWPRAGRPDGGKDEILFFATVFMPSLLYIGYRGLLLRG